MTAVHNYPLSTALADARAALCCPKGAPAAELAGHLLMLEMYGNEDEQAYARDFAGDMRHREDLALWLPIIMVPPRRELPPIAPVSRETPVQVIARHRRDWFGIIAASLIFGLALAQLTFGVM